MTLNQIVVAALDILEYGHSAQTVGKYWDAFAQYVNAAVIDIANSITLYRTETIDVDGTFFYVKDLPGICTKIVSVLQGGRPVWFKDGGATGMIAIEQPGTTVVTYQYIPETATSDTDEPDVPRQYHRMIVNYVVGSYRASGDANSQAGAGIYLQLYNNEKTALMRHYGAHDNYQLKNIY